MPLAVPVVEFVVIKGVPAGANANAQRMFIHKIFSVINSATIVITLYALYYAVP